MEPKEKQNSKKKDEKRKRKNNEDRRKIRRKIATEENDSMHKVIDSDYDSRETESILSVKSETPFMDETEEKRHLENKSFGIEDGSLINTEISDKCLEGMVSIIDYSMRDDEEKQNDKIEKSALIKIEKNEESTSFFTFVKCESKSDEVKNEKRVKVKDNNLKVKNMPDELPEFQKTCLKDNKKIESNELLILGPENKGIFLENNTNFESDKIQKTIPNYKNKGIDEENKKELSEFQDSIIKNISTGKENNKQSPELQIINAENNPLVEKNKSESTESQEINASNQNLEEENSKEVFRFKNTGFNDENNSLKGENGNNTFKFQNNEFNNEKNSLKEEDNPSKNTVKILANEHFNNVETDKTDEDSYLSGNPAIISPIMEQCKKNKEEIESAILLNKNSVIELGDIDSNIKSSFINESESKNPGTFFSHKDKNVDHGMSHFLSNKVYTQYENSKEGHIDSIPLHVDEFNSFCNLFKFENSEWVSYGKGNVIIRNHNDDKRLIFVREKVLMVSFDILVTYDMKNSLSKNKVIFFVLGEKAGVYCCKFFDEIDATKFNDLITLSK